MVEPHKNPTTSHFSWSSKATSLPQPIRIAGDRPPPLRPDCRGLRLRTLLRSAKAAGIDGQPCGDQGADYAIAGATSGQLDGWCQFLMNHLRKRLTKIGVWYGMMNSSELDWGSVALPSGKHKKHQTMLDLPIKRGILVYQRVIFDWDITGEKDDNTWLNWWWVAGEITV